MSAYVIGQVTVHDSAEYEKYLAGFMDAFAPFDGHVLVAANDVDVLEGTWPRARTVVLEFPSMEHAQRWYKSPAYQSIAQHRFKAATSNIILAHGFETAPR
jgi:uncharacterized protein (DUF1330 family)